MGSAIIIFAGPRDEAVFRNYARSIGLRLLHPHAHEMTKNENRKAFNNPVQGGYFSFLPIDRLGRHPNPDIGLCDVIDPIILYVRPHYTHPYLVAGQVVWNNDVKELAEQTKRYFKKLLRWVKDNWRCRDEDKCYIGPEAELILKQEGVSISYSPPGVDIETDNF